MYREFAFIYDDLMKDFDYEKWLEYIEEIWDLYNVDIKNVLEMAAGTGNLSQQIAKKGYQLDCFDLSEDMLSLLDNKIGHMKNVSIFRQDMRDFNLDKKYSSILAVCDSINYIREGVDQVFKRVYNHLDEGGLFIFDINSDYKLRHIISENTFINEEDGVFYSWENTFIQDNILEFYLNFFIENEDGSYQRFDELHYERIYQEDELIDLLKAAGFKEVKTMEAFSFKEVGDKTERINFIARK